MEILICPRRSAKSPRRGAKSPRRGAKSPRRGAKMLWLGCFLLLTAACALMLPLHVFGSSDPATAKVFVGLSWGEGEGQVGLVRATEGLTRGPEALAIAPDGRVAILDSVNSRLVLLDSDGQPLQPIRVDLAEPRFLAADDDVLYVLDADADKKLASYSWSGTLTGVLDVPETDSVVTGLFATSQGACIETGHRDSLLVDKMALQLASKTGADAAPWTAAELPGRPLDHRLATVVKAGFSLAEGFRMEARSVGEGGRLLGEAAQLRPSLARGSAIEHLLSVDGDGDGGLLVGAKLAQPMTAGQVTSVLAITRLRSADPGGTSDALQLAQAANDEVLLLAESDYAYLGDPYVVAPDGRIFQPVADASGYTILVHSFAEVQP